MSTSVPNQNFLQDLVPAKSRKVVYALYGLVGFLLGAGTVAYAAIQNSGIPDGLTVANAVYAFSGIAFSSLAGSNVSTPVLPPGE